MLSSHADLDINLRLEKARKIHRLLPPADTSKELRLLEIGTGSGIIAYYFSQLRAPAFAVDAVDILDQRRMSDGYRFHLYDGSKLPFADGQFDYVISNHVIEHIGDRSQQAAHLQEIRRMLAPGGYAYLATPSRWQIVEPHFRLPFLGWLPKRLQDSYVRATGKGTHYDCNPLRPVELRHLLEHSELSFENLNARALQVLAELEKPGSLVARIASRLPFTLLDSLQDASPAMIYLLKKDHHTAGNNPESR